MAQPTLHDLVEAAGLKPDYYDAWGDPVTVSETSLCELLAAMGLPAWDQADIARSYQEVTERPWQRLLPPVVVATVAEQPVAVRVNVPDGLAERSLSWRLVAEDGTIADSGELVAGYMPALASREVAGEAITARELRPNVALGYGYHRLLARLGADRPEREMAVIVAPERGLLPEDAGTGRHSWGFTTQLYSLWREGGWGIGDFTDLGDLLEKAAGCGAALVGTNPLHAEFPADWNHYSPYSPSSRLFLNVLYVDVEAVAEFGESPAAREQAGDPDLRAHLDRAQASELIDYRAVWWAKLRVLEKLFQTFKARHLDDDVSARGRAFAQYRAEMGQGLTDFATFHALHEHYFGSDPFKWDWRSWDGEHRDPHSDAVRDFQERHQDRILFYCYIHWLADLQLEDAQARAKAAGMPLGVYRDLAVGAEIGAAEAWAQQDIYATEAVVGAPPDILGPKGQNWGLAPMNPVALQHKAYQPFVQLLRANMRHAGALRIDHAMSLMRLFWIPVGREAKDGAYVLYPFQDMLRVVALESWRNGCCVVGEDLGTVPEGFRPAAQGAGIQSTSVMLFEMNADGSFKAPADYPPNAAATVATHDLPTLVGWWRGRDIEIRRDYDLYPDPAMLEQDEVKRPKERRALVRAIAAAGELPDSIDPEGPLPEQLTQPLFLAVHRFVAKTPCRLVLAQLEDANLQLEPVNVPGTGHDPPNWRRRHPYSVAALFDQPWMAELARGFNALRGLPR